MTKIIDYKKIDMTDQEYDHYNNLIKIFTDEHIDGNSYFKDLLQTDEDGLILTINTTKSIPWAILFFAQQLMINQRLRLNDLLSKKLDSAIKRIEQIEKKISDK